MFLVICDAGVIRGVVFRGVGIGIVVWEVGIRWDVLVYYIDGVSGDEVGGK